MKPIDMTDNAIIIEELRKIKYSVFDTGDTVFRHLYSDTWLPMELISEFSDHDEIDIVVFHHDITIFTTDPMVTRLGDGHGKRFYYKLICYAGGKTIGGKKREGEDQWDVLDSDTVDLLTTMIKRFAIRRGIFDA